MPDKNSEERSFGFLLIDKRSGPTSHDIIYKLRKITGEKKIGHAGTLDPFASGLLIVAVGREATRQISRFVKMDKTYEAVLRLGAFSDTYDRTGVISRGRNLVSPREDEINITLLKFTGKQRQIPPMFSAKKSQGRKLYELARQGIDKEREAADIIVYDIKLLGYQWPLLNINIKCSSGTYIRSLAHDIGRSLGCGAYAEELKRTAIGQFRVDQAVDIDRLESGNWRSLLF
ncbi:MAG: tRNA pseudouridine(55) synthase TruB [Planctomycetes bacterium]|jgi:tRNA pseudouridine55 synthase|nr:tRNA pseudouridine(55) synthase TruB [Planctomycetota bacterium]